MGRGLFFRLRPDLLPTDILRRERLLWRKTSCSNTDGTRYIRLTYNNNAGRDNGQLNNMLHDQQQLSLHLQSTPPLRLLHHLCAIVLPGRRHLPSRWDMPLHLPRRCERDWLLHGGLHRPDMEGPRVRTTM